MAQLTIRGSVRVQGGTFPVAGVAVTASLWLAAADDVQSQDAVRLHLGRAETDTDGAFTIESDPADPRVSRWACALENCPEFALRLSCLDRDGASMHESEAIPYRADHITQIELREPDGDPSGDEWMALGRRMRAAQTVRVNALARELTSLAPKGIFRDWTVARRLGVLRRVEQALLDPDNVLGNSQVPVSFHRLTDEHSLRELRERLQRLQRGELMDALNRAVERAHLFGDMREINVHVDADRISQGDIVGGVNRFREPDLSFGDLYPWLKSPLEGYRDYLRDRWSEHQRFEPVLGGPDAEVASRATMFARLGQRLHQRFDTHDQTDQPANRLLIPILTEILMAPAGAGYGFGIAPAAIDAMDDRTDREYVDYLISLTGLKLAEIEKRYRLNL
ncbi:MAG TPA: hypothetical protein VGO97_06025, partial [Solirubrobacterales bacterium]|nr:hypothetical protein [Solirubrobacterales bacterium]